MGREGGRGGCTLSLVVVVDVCWVDRNLVGAREVRMGLRSESIGRGSRGGIVGCWIWGSEGVWVRCLGEGCVMS